jgi:hypothetical protein
VIIQSPPLIPFDPNQLIPLVGVIGVMVIGGIVLYTFLKSELAAALSARLRAGIHRRKPGEDVGDEGRVVQLEEQVDALHSQIGELAERLDFAERLLAQKRERSLPGA